MIYCVLIQRQNKWTMTKKLVSVSAMILAALVVLFVFIEQNKEMPLQQDRFRVQTFATGDGGWGYSIFDGEKQIIKQDIIPAIRKNVSFQSEKDALQTGLLVIEKLKHNKLPTISREELERLHILSAN